MRELHKATRRQHCKKTPENKYFLSLTPQGPEHLGNLWWLEAIEQKHKGNIGGLEINYL
jgi:hypothetical protein